MQHQQTFTNPRIPFVGPVWQTLSPGSMIRIQGEVPPTADRFNINLHCGSPLSDVAFHISVRLLQNYIARNSMLDDSWGDEEDSGVLSILPGQAFEILILCDPACYKVAVNGNHFCDFRHRAPFQKVTHLVIDGEVSLHLIAYEDASGSHGPSAPPPVQGGGADFYGPPRSPKARRPPTPPGAEEESGFEQFLETAGTIIAGAIATGAASTIIGNLTGHGNDQQQQQQRYQRPPSPQPSPIQSLLFPSTTSYTPPPAGGLGGAVGSILGSVAEQMLKPKEHHH